MSKNESKWIEIREAGTSPTGKTRVWDVINIRKEIRVGQIRWHGAWRKYAYFTEDEDIADFWIFDAECLKQIAVKLDEVNAAWKRRVV